MAILQEANAVFYHPLDNLTESLKSQPWSGQSLFNTGKVVDALHQDSGDSISGFTAGAEYHNAAISETSIVLMSASTFVIVYTDGSGNGTAKVGTIAGVDVTFGPVHNFTAENTTTTIASALSANTFVVVYRKSTSNSGAAKVGTVSGTDITYGTETEFIGAGGLSGSDMSAVVVSASSFVVAYRNANNLNHGAARVGAIIGTSILFGSESEFLTVTGAFEIRITALSGTKVVVAYQDQGDSSKGTAKVGTVTGATIAFGVESEFTTVLVNNVSVASLSASVFVVAYRRTGSPGAARVGTVTGTNIVFGTEVVFLAAGTGVEINVIAMSVSAFAVVYTDSPTRGATRVGIVSGTVIAFGAESEFQTGSVSTIGAAALSSTQFIIGYADPTNFNAGVVKVATVSPVASALSSSSLFGADAEFFAANAASVLAVLSTTAFVVAYNNGATGFARVGTITGSSIAFGPEGAFYVGGASGNPGSISMTTLSATSFVIGHAAGTSAPDLQKGLAIFGTVAGTDITFGAATQFNAFNTALIRVSAITSTSFVVAFQELSSNMKAHVGDIVGTTVVFGPLLSTLIPTASLESLKALSSTTVVLVYRSSVGSIGTAIIGTVTGSSIVFAIPAGFSVGSSNNLSIAVLSPSKFAVVYRDDLDLGHGKAKIGTVSGTDITFGTEATFLTGSIVDISVSTLSATSFVVAYSENSVVSKTRVGTVVGTNVIFDAGAEFLNGNAFSISVEVVDAPKFVVSWGLSNSAAKIGTAGLSDYQSTIGATRLAFSSWSR